MTEEPLLYDSQPRTDFDSQFARIFEAAECRTQLELAEFLNIKSSSVSDAKRRKTVPSEWLVKLLKRSGSIRSGYATELAANLCTWLLIKKVRGP